MTSDKRAPGYLVIEVDGARFASLPEETVAELRFRSGEMLDHDRFDQLCRVAAVESAYWVAMRLLSARPRAVNEMLRRLRDRGHDDVAAGKAVRRLQERGLLDDLEFSRHFARVRSSKGHGAARLVTDLLAKGVEKSTAQRGVAETLEDEEVDPLVQARLLAEKRCGQLGNLSAEKKRRRLMAYLQRRGYWGYEINQMVGEVLAGG